ncbi:hypothetical protein MRX96_025506 [Rhipicephalus microplus]
MSGAASALEVKPTKSTVKSSSGALVHGKVVMPTPVNVTDAKVAPRHGHSTGRLPQSKREHQQHPIQTTFSSVTGTPSRDLGSLSVLTSSVALRNAGGY